MQKLDVVARLFPLLITGEKTSTIRFREAQIHVGPMDYWCEGNPEKTVTVWVYNCSDMALSEVAAFLGKAEEWSDKVTVSYTHLTLPTNREV